MDHTPEHKTDYAALYGNPTNNIIMIMLSFTKFVTLILFRDARNRVHFPSFPDIEDASTWNPSSRKRATCLSYKANTTAANDLEMQGARVSAAMRDTFHTEIPAASTIACKHISTPFWHPNCVIVTIRVSGDVPRSSRKPHEPVWLAPRHPSETWPPYCCGWSRSSASPCKVPGAN